MSKIPNCNIFPFYKLHITKNQQVELHFFQLFQSWLKNWECSVVLVPFPLSVKGNVKTCEPWRSMEASWSCRFSFTPPYVYSVFDCDSLFCVKFVAWLLSQPQILINYNSDWKKHWKLWSYFWKGSLGLSVQTEAILPPRVWWCYFKGMPTGPFPKIRKSQFPAFCFSRKLLFWNLSAWIFFKTAYKPSFWRVMDLTVGRTSSLWILMVPTHCALGIL